VGALDCAEADRANVCCVIRTAVGRAVAGEGGWSDGADVGCLDVCWTGFVRIGAPVCVVCIVGAGVDSIGISGAAVDGTAACNCAEAA
jgi:hypothetical protein